MTLLHSLLHRREIREKRRRERNGVNAEPLGSELRLHRYLDAEGNFDYQAYRAEQVAGNHRKIDQSWVKEEEIDFLSEHVLRLVPSPAFGLCHGTRRGLEQTWFHERLGCEVIGTEISDTAEDFPRTVRWDFHETRPDWLDAADFIYSNSFDHSYDPEKCLNAWMSCLRPGGVCLIEHSEKSEPEAVTKLDPFGARLTLMPWLILGWGRGRYGVREVIASPDDAEVRKHWLVVQRHTEPPAFRLRDGAARAASDVRLRG